MHSTIISKNYDSLKNQGPVSTIRLIQALRIRHKTTVSTRKQANDDDYNNDRIPYHNIHF
ncbi:hypothetical protein [Sinomicrobium soli]|uniref:hypothetical protein n=1 Tax=Sinomicrobium sp. N-1-3-6 TaxID=2219864 RepID=UPI000DD9518E|nr:hypothetical protein [Sinomicrobium sp. N-1-3-6]